jgi:hypothetical protein
MVITDYFTNFSNMSFGEKIVQGLLIPFKLLKQVLIQPFIDLWEWFKSSPLSGKSPSKLGLMIVDGLKAVQSMLVNLLISPFEMAWKYIKEIPFVGSLFKNIGTTVGNIVRPTVTVDKSTTNPDATIRANDIKATIIPSNEEVLKKLDMVVVAIDKLTAGFASGNLRAVVSIDGQRIDVATGRALEFRGALV